MERPGATDGLAAAQAGLEKVCALLTAPTPEVLDRTAVILASVAAEIGRGWRAQPGRDLRGIRQAARRASILLEKASAYHAGWLACLGSRTGGYRAGGAAAAVVPQRRLSLEG